MEKRYGPEKGAGTVVIEKEAEKTIEKGTLGTTVHIGVLERGPVGKLFKNATKTEYLRNAGGYIDESLAPDNAFDFYRTSRGAGELYHVRVTDGTEVKSGLILKGRKKVALIQNVSADCASDKAFVTNAAYVELGAPKVGSRVVLKNTSGSTQMLIVTAVTPDTPSVGTVQLTMSGAVLADYTLVKETQVIVYNKSINADSMRVKANNGGRWAGKKQSHVGLDFGVGGLTSITFDTGLTLLQDQLKGGLLSFAAIPGKSYEIISNTTSGVVTVTVDSNMVSDYALTGSSVEQWKVQLWNDKAVSVVVTDSILNPATMFGMTVLLDGVEVLSYPELSMDSNSKYYFESYINDDEMNVFITVENLWVGGQSASIRPANWHGQSINISDTVLTLEGVETLADETNTGDGYIKDFVYGGDCQADTVVIECVEATLKKFKYTSTKMGVVSVDGIEVATPFVAPNDFSVGFTVVEGATPFIVGDKFTLYVKPFVPNALVGGFVYPNVDTDRRTKYKITANSYDTLTVKPSDKMKDSAVVGNTFRIEYADELAGGYDGLANVIDANYLSLLDPATSPINSLFGMAKGLVKVACPGVSSSAVQKAGADYCDARNYQFRYEIPSNITTETGAEQYINETLGRSDFAVVTFPSYIYVTHPTKAGLKLIPATGAIHGREALVAKNYQGYHKASSGVDVTIPHCLKLPTGDKVLDEETLNPQGIGVLKFKSGICIIWGDRTLAVDPTWQWKHQRETMSYYENDMREKFDWIIYTINDPITEKLGKSALLSYFRPEHKKRALRGATFKDACEIKFDEEINTDNTRAKGDMLTEISLRLADTTERFIITMSKMGIFDSTS